MNLQHWVVCLDLSKIDPILIRYVNYLADKLEPETVTFYHVMETSSVSGDLQEIHPIKKFYHSAVSFALIQK